MPKTSGGSRSATAGGGARASGVAFGRSSTSRAQGGMRTTHTIGSEPAALDRARGVLEGVPVGGRMTVYAADRMGGFDLAVGQNSAGQRTYQPFAGQGRATRDAGQAINRAMSRLRQNPPRTTPYRPGG